MKARRRQKKDPEVLIMEIPPTYRFIGGTSTSARPALNVSREGTNYILFARTLLGRTIEKESDGPSGKITHFRMSVHKI